jgi:hypothetical protein
MPEPRLGSLFQACRAAKDGAEREALLAAESDAGLRSRVKEFLAADREVTRSFLEPGKGSSRSASARD